MSSLTPLFTPHIQCVRNTCCLYLQNIALGPGPSDQGQIYTRLKSDYFLTSSTASILVKSPLFLSRIIAVISQTGFTLYKRILDWLILKGEAVMILLVSRTCHLRAQSLDDLPFHEESKPRPSLPLPQALYDVPPFLLGPECSLLLLSFNPPSS